MLNISHDLKYLYQHRRYCGQETDIYYLALGQRCYGKQVLHKRNEHDNAQQDYAGCKRSQAVPVAGKAQPEDIVFASAVKSVEQAGQGKGGKCHGAGPSGAALMKPGGIGPHGGCCNQGSLDQDIPLSLIHI
mgnify:CR=1 FL=1